MDFYQIWLVVSSRALRPYQPWQILGQSVQVSILLTGGQKFHFPPCHYNSAAQRHSPWCNVSVHITQTHWYIYDKHTGLLILAVNTVSSRCGAYVSAVMWFTGGRRRCRFAGKSREVRALATVAATDRRVDWPLAITGHQVTDHCPLTVSSFDRSQLYSTNHLEKISNHSCSVPSDPL